MTLSTNMWVLDRIDREEVFAKCRELIGAGDGYRYTDRDGYHDDGTKALMGEPGQGYPAWLTLYYHPDGALREDDRCSPDCDDDCDRKWHPAAWLEVNWDTAYSYRDDMGRGCGLLHATYIASLGRWLDGRGVRWLWENEFTGEIHEGYDKLGDLIHGGGEARDWLYRAVLPAILADEAASR